MKFVYSMIQGRDFKKCIKLNLETNFEDYKQI